ncbi:MAG: hypothetical protein LBK25_01660 [Treponema sp.]|nr:hypothetical protein [Treponema sp.]
MIFKKLLTFLENLLMILENLLPILENLLMISEKLLYFSGVSFRRRVVHRLCSQRRSSETRWWTLCVSGSAALPFR